MSELDDAELDMAISRAGQHVGIPGHKVHGFLETLKMCGYELRKIEALPPSAANGSKE